MFLYVRPDHRQQILRRLPHPEARQEAHLRPHAPLFLLFNRDGLAHLPLLWTVHPYPGGHCLAACSTRRLGPGRFGGANRNRIRVRLLEQRRRHKPCGCSPVRNSHSGRFHRRIPVGPGKQKYTDLHPILGTLSQCASITANRVRSVLTITTRRTHNAYICCICNWSDSCVTPPSTCEPCPNSVT